MDAEYTRSSTPQHDTHSSTAAARTSVRSSGATASAADMREGFTRKEEAGCCLSVVCENHDGPVSAWTIQAFRL